MSRLQAAEGRLALILNGYSAKSVFWNRAIETEDCRLDQKWRNQSKRPGRSTAIADRPAVPANLIAPRVELADAPRLSPRRWVLTIALSATYRHSECDTSPWGSLPPCRLASRFIGRARQWPEFALRPWLPNRLLNCVHGTCRIPGGRADAVLTPVAPWGAVGIVVSAHDRSGNGYWSPTPGRPR
jgi:hypothetical protein